MLGLHQGWWLKTDFAPTGRIPTSTTKEPTIADYMNEFVRLGYLEQVQAFSLAVKKEPIGAMINASFCSDEMKAAMKKLVEKRIKELQDALTQKSN
jgi:hypothetical protein